MVIKMQEKNPKQFEVSGGIWSNQGSSFLKQLLGSHVALIGRFLKNCIIEISITFFRNVQLTRFDLIKAHTNIQRMIPIISHSQLNEFCPLENLES